ncbi:unnamed protein product [Closterium sp. Naga37s-1]|nr:unnamed protein product [Closterium sp. Naga37s-1]
MPLRLRRRKKGWVDSPIPLFAKYWTDTTLKGGPYHGFTANGRYPAQSRPPILSPLSLSQFQKIPGRLLLFPWRLLPRHGTIAADTAHYPFGTQMFIPGYGWGIVDDKGSAIRGATRIDLYHYSHNEALHWGRRRVNVLVVPPGESVRGRLELSSGIELLERCESGAGGPLAAPMFFTEAPRDPSGAGGSASAAGPAGAVAVDPALMDGLRVKLAELQRMCADMGQLWRNHANKTQRELWRRRVEVMGEEAEALRLALDRCAAKEHRRRREAQERAELLVARAGGQGGRILSEADAEIRDMETAKRAGRVLEDTLAQGIATLSHMAQQREVLKVRVVQLGWGRVLLRCHVGGGTTGGEEGGGRARAGGYVGAGDCDAVTHGAAEGVVEVFLFPLSPRLHSSTFPPSLPSSQSAQRRALDMLNYVGLSDAAQSPLLILFLSPTPHPPLPSQSAQRRALDMLNYVGLSDAVLKKINRRQLVDRAISYGGMLLTLIVIFIVWRWTR